MSEGIREEELGSWDRSERPLGLREEELWSAPFEHQSDLFERAVKEKRLGVTIDVPQRVELDRRTTLPLVGAVLLTRREEAVLQIGRAGIIVAVELETGRCLVGRARDPELIAEPEEPPHDPGEGLSFQMFSVDLRARLELPWAPRSYLVTFLLRERASNRVRTEVLRSPLAYRDPAVEQIRADHRPPLVPVWPPRIRMMPGALPDYRRTSSSPALPEDIGVAIAVDRVTHLKREARCVVRGSFRLPVRDHERVPRGSGIETGDGEATAVVPITLVLTGADQPAPIVLHLRVPSVDPLPREVAQPLATGHFTLDLFDLEAGPRAPQTYFLYAFAAEVLVGPIPFAIVAPEELT